jgi:A/G-specific adenine glycosylase
MGEPSATEVRARLLAWYGANRRDLPWRRTRDPYRILIAEYLLQRTRIVSGTPYYDRFLERFPTVQDLAAAPLDDVLAVWEGLGFYRRARNLHTAARVIVDRFAGEIPHSFEELESLPGIGPYTAGAVASIAFGIPVPAVDGNVTRVIARLFRIRDDVRTAAMGRRIGGIAGSLVPSENPGAFNQAMMELGAIVCTPTSPSCGRCPLESLCLARAAGEEGELPVASRASSTPIIPVAFALVESRGNVLLVRRPAGALLGGLWGLPGGETHSKKGERDALRAMVREQAGVSVDVGPRWAGVDRTFSHRKWSGAIYRCTPRRRPEASETVRWVPCDEALRLPLVPFHREAIKSLAGLESFADR